MNIKKSLTVLAVAAAAVAAKDYSGAELYTKQEFQYGKFEARMQMGAVSGTVSSMFLYQNGSEQSSAERWVEVDIEVLGKEPNKFQSNIITGRSGAQIKSEKLHTVNPATTAAFHTYCIEWTPDYVRWTVDGNEVRKATKGQSTDTANQVGNLIGTQGLRFNLWSSESTDWVGAFSDGNLPVFQFINWVKVYKYTPGQGPDGSDFTLDWIDNFDTFDASRWGKGNWTFDGNRVDLTEQNIYSRDGMLILALTRKGQEMFTGTVPVDNEASPIVSSSSGTSQPTSSSSEHPNSSNSYNPQPASSSATNPWEQPTSSATIEAIQKPATEKKLQPRNHSSYNAKGEKVNKNRASHYRVDFTL